MPWFVKIEEGIVNKATFDTYIPAHKAYVQDLIAKGHQAKTGYWAERGGGMLLFKADSLEEAQAIVEGDPLVQPTFRRCGGKFFISCEKGGIKSFSV